MQYQKPALTFDQQADLLLHRGIIGSRGVIIDRLKSVNYYRLSAYSFPFRKGAGDDHFKDGTTFDMIWDRYVFDRHLRLLIMDAIERVEISVRTNLAYHHAHKFGSFAYMDDPTSLPGLSSDQLKGFHNKARKVFTSSHEHFVILFKSKYPRSSCLPVWMATEIMTIGNILTFFRGCPRYIKKDIAAVFRVPDDVFDSWLLSLNTVRNICAHHSRIWNRIIGTKPFIPRPGKYPAWHNPVSIQNNRTFAILCICRHCIKCVAPQSGWDHRLRALLEKYPGISVSEMGFPAKWETHAIWS